MSVVTICQMHQVQPLICIHYYVAICCYDYTFYCVVILQGFIYWEGGGGGGEGSTPNSASSPPKIFK